MKRTIVIEIILLLTVILLIFCGVFLFRYAEDLKLSIRLSGADELVTERLNETLTLGILVIIFSIANLAAMVLIAFQNFKCFKPIVDKITIKLAAKKAERKAKREEQAEVAKQARIEKLQAELDELKKDE